MFLKLPFATSFSVLYIYISIYMHINITYQSVNQSIKFISKTKCEQNEHGNIKH